MINTTITPITYKDAANLLKINIGSLRHAVLRNVLTRLPHREKERYLAKEQVDLFVNKQLSLSLLSLEEKEKWQKIKNTIEEYQYTDNSQPPVFILIGSNIDEMLKQLELFFSNKNNLTKSYKEKIESLSTT